MTQLFGPALPKGFLETSWASMQEWYKEYVKHFPTEIKFSKDYRRITIDVKTAYRFQELRRLIRSCVPKASDERLDFKKWNSMSKKDLPFELETNTNIEDLQTLCKVLNG